MNKIIDKINIILYKLYLNFKELYRDSRRLYIILENTFKLNYKNFYKKVFFLALN